jgi:putative transposase
MKFETNNHSVFALHYDLILVIKYRKPVISDTVSQYLKCMFERIGSDYKINIEVWNYEQDHIHVLFSAHPKSELSKFINAYKSASSRLVKKEFPNIKHSLWQEHFWSQSFCLLTTGGVTIDVIQKYINKQGEK